MKARHALSHRVRQDDIIGVAFGQGNIPNLRPSPNWAITSVT